MGGDVFIIFRIDYCASEGIESLVSEKNIVSFLLVSNIYLKLYLLSFHFSNNYVDSKVSYEMIIFVVTIDLTIIFKSDFQKFLINLLLIINFQEIDSDH